MAGYNGFRMSNNAVAAYESGEKPFSRWTKKNILDAIATAISDGELVLNCSINELKKVPVKVLKNMCLTYSSWHHTSNHYNKTDFYALDIDAIETLTDDKLKEEVAKIRAGKNEEPAEEKWKCAFLEWSGTYKHPKATEVIEEGVVKGDWFIRKDGSKKKTTANGFRFIEKIQ